MEIKIEEMADKTIITLIGKLDTVTSPDFQEKSLATLEQASKEIWIECSELEYISSAGLRSMLILAKKATSNNIQVILYNINKMVKDILEVSGFDSFFEVKYGNNK